MSYTLKRTSVEPKTRNSPEVIQSRYEYALNFCQLDENKMFFLDEAGFQINRGRKYGRSKPGSKAVQQIPKIRMKNYSVEAVISKDCLYFFEVMDRPYNAEHFDEFIDEFLDFLGRDGAEDAILVMYNVRFHHNPEIRSKIESKEHSFMFISLLQPIFESHRRSFF